MNIQRSGFTPLETIGRQKKAIVSLTGFTLLELIVVIVIIGILAVISLPQFSAMKENSLDQEAIANLKLIQAAEKIYKMEVTFYASCANAVAINSWLRLSIPTASTNWNYKVEVTSEYTPGNLFTANAQRVPTGRAKCIDEANIDPYPCD